MQCRFVLVLLGLLAFPLLGCEKKSRVVIHLRHEDGTPAAGVELSFDHQEKISDRSGTATFVVPLPYCYQEEVLLPDGQCFVGGDGYIITVSEPKHEVPILIKSCKNAK